MSLDYPGPRDNPEVKKILSGRKEPSYDLYDYDPGNGVQGEFPRPEDQTPEPFRKRPAR